MKPLTKVWRTSLCLILLLTMTACASGEKQENTATGAPVVQTTAEDAAVSGAASGGPSTDSQISDTEGAALKDLYSKYFLMGAAINGSEAETAAIRHEGMAAVLKKHYNSTTLSNLMKPCYLLDEKKCRGAAKKDKDIETAEVYLNFDSCRESLDFCKENGIQMRGHTLVWHNQTPAWFFKKGYDESKGYVSKDVMAKRMENYIQGVLDYCQTNYPGVVYCWDVVNECVDDVPGTGKGWPCRSVFNGDDNYWYATMGKDYAFKAFEYARKYADKDVKLFYNDYNVFQPAKRDSIYNYVSELKKKGWIDGIGLQPTVDLYNPMELKGDSDDSFETCLRKYAELGLDIQVTELSFKIDEEQDVRNEDTIKLQADRYQEMFELLKEMDDAGGGPCNITSVTVFGICDDYPLYDDCVQSLYLWDKECKPKEAFFRIRSVGGTT